MTALRPFVPFGVPHATPRASEELALRYLGGTAGQAALIAEIPPLLDALSAAIAALSSPVSTTTAPLVGDARAITHCVERLHELVRSLHKDT